MNRGLKTSFITVVLTASLTACAGDLREESAIANKHWVDITVYDTQDREMLENNDSGQIPGNNCSSGIVSGQSGHRYVAYEGPKDAEIGYAVFEDYTAYESMPIILNPDLTLHEQ